jgi:hypothetical protein
MKKTNVEEMPLEKFIELLKELNCEQVVVGAPRQPDMILQKKPKSSEEVKE